MIYSHIHHGGEGIFINDELSQLRKLTSPYFTFEHTAVTFIVNTSQKLTFVVIY